MNEDCWTCKHCHPERLNNVCGAPAHMGDRVEKVLTSKQCSHWIVGTDIAHKPGDRIYISRHQIGRVIDGRILVVDQAKYLGKAATIVSYGFTHDGNGTDGYHIDIDNGEYVWSDGCFGRPPLIKFPRFR